jgi:hypothetical protein
LFTTQAEEEGRVIDMLDPPVDPLMRRGRNNARDMYNPIPIMPSANGGSTGSLGTGFDLDTVSSFDSEISKSDDFSNSSSGSESGEEAATSSSAWYNPFGK